jgi:predicted metal-dependent phosphotriesterase family hydrolase
VLQDGYAPQVIVSHDCAMCQRGQVLPDSQLKSDPTLFMREIAPQLRQMGIEAAVLDGVFRDNPRRYFCDEPPPQRAAAMSAAAAAG